MAYWRVLLPRDRRLNDGDPDGIVRKRNYQKYVMKDSLIGNDMCRLCGKQSGTIQHIISSREKLVTKEYKERHDSVATVLHSVNFLCFYAERFDPWILVCTIPTRIF